MVINENALYQGKLWCAYELKDAYGNYKEELRLHMRKESQNNQFICLDCGAYLILCAGPVMEPFFKHHDNSNCITISEEGKKRNVIARRMLYYLARASFPDAVIEFNVKGSKMQCSKESSILKEEEKGQISFHFDEEMRPSKNNIDKFRADLFITCNQTKLVFEYLGYEIKLSDWEEKHQFYLDNNIIDLWFLNYKHYKNETSTTFEYMLSKHLPVLTMLDYEQSHANSWRGYIILKERIKLSNNHGYKLIAKSYPLAEITINEAGEFICDYKEYRQQQLLPNEELIHVNSNKTKDTIEVVPMDEKEEDFFQVIRRKESEGNITKFTMKMASIGELWDLPVITGSDFLVRHANNDRYLYLKNLNKRLEELTEETDRNLLIEQAIKVIERKQEAYLWK